jgi:lysophospholipase L1-like esterase
MSSGLISVRGDQREGHVVLVGDSIFDNAAYVGSGPAVIDQVNSALPSQWKATLLAIDGAMTGDISHQLSRLPSDTTHIVVSVGGNDALSHKSLLDEKADSVADVLARLAKIQRLFRGAYNSMLDQVTELGIPTAVCTIYNSRYPDLAEREIANVGLTIFNDVITQEAAIHGLPVIDLRTIFQSDDDYANAVEPSSKGGEKIAAAIAHLIPASSTQDLASAFKQPNQAHVPWRWLLSKHE